MFSTILFPTDFSKTAERAFEYVKKLKEAGNKKVLLVHIIEGSELEAIEEVKLDLDQFGEHTIESIEEHLIAKSRKKLEPYADQLKLNGIDTAIYVEVGKPSKEILELADKENVDLIVLGERGMTELRELLLMGSVAGKVLQHSKIPVLVIKTKK